MNNIFGISASWSKTLFYYQINESRIDCYNKISSILDQVETFIHDQQTSSALIELYSRFVPAHMGLI